MSVPRTRLLDLMKVQCRIFSHTFNPEGLRLGNKVLRQRLKGPVLAAYYPRKISTLKDLRKAYSGPDGFEIPNDDHDDWEENHKIIKARGKGAPKKKRTAEESKKFKGKKR
ncbi:mitochondrial ribosomal subunit S27-domain-containing protein [Calycina marina]|uniref:Small ribosomal subunit protein mS33 n=1 Tax=Calycina marina TaxID=1763456 RepID=A0A9P8CE67_9HELO|nr:mitochondrial ribosomal subunit S27-domain-containing protein [Calycina marina]